MARPPKTRIVDPSLLTGLGIDAEQLAALSETERAYALQCLEEMAEHGASATAISMLMEDYKWEPVSMEQFLSDPFYMGDLTKDLFPAWRAALIEAFDNGRRPVEMILAGAIGTGKTTVAGVILTYLAYRLTCLRDPHAYYRLMKGQPVIIGMYSIDLDQAMATSYGKILNWVDAIPYFLQKCPRVKRINSVIKFSTCPVEVIAGSKETHTIGRDMFAFLLDEANFMKAANGDVDEGVAFSIYNNAARRVKSRFLAGSGEPAGMAILASSKRTKAAFLEKHVKESADDIRDGRTRVYSFSQWEVKPAALFKKPRFQVEVGDRMYASRILRPGEAPRQGADVIHVPGEYLDDFTKDCDKALRDLAGVASESMMPLFHDKSVIRRCCVAEHRHPFTRQELSISIADEIGIDAYFRPEMMFAVVRSRYQLRLNPQCPRYVHIDIAFTSDSMGIAMVHLAGIKIVKRARKDGTYYEDKAPLIVVDFVLRIRPPQNSEIDLAKARGFILSLIDMGVPIKQVNYDGHQSRESCQTLKKLGIPSNVNSMDKTDQPYIMLRQTMVEQRLIMYEYAHLNIELSELERDVDKGKVNHPKTSSATGQLGSKDVADGLCGAVYAATMDKEAFMLMSVPQPQEPARVASATKVGVTGGSHLWSNLDKGVG